jgi:hypothetical protein
MKLFHYTIPMLALALATFIPTPAAHAQTTFETNLTLNIAVDNLLAVEATVSGTVSNQNGQLVIVGQISGTAVVNGTAASIVVQPVTVVVAASCKAGGATLSVSTSRIVASLSTGLTATIEPLTVTTTSTCGRTPTLTATTSPARITLSDKTTLSVSSCTVSLSSPSSTLIGTLVCEVHDLSCTLASILSSGGSLNDAVNALQGTLNDILAVINK